MIVVVPSRGRPQNISELIESFYETCKAKTQLWVCVDNDDPELEEYSRVIYEGPSAAAYLWVDKPSRIGPILNRVVPIAAAQDDVVAFMGDDHRPRTVAWDQLYINNLRAMRTGVVYGNDLIQGEGIPTQCAMTSNIVKATGHFVPDNMLHLWLDNAWKAIGEAVGIRYLGDVIVEHMHPLAGKAEWDASYLQNNADEVFSADKAVFEHWRQHILPEWVEKIRAYNG